MLTLMFFFTGLHLAEHFRSNDDKLTLKGQISSWGDSKYPWRYRQKATLIFCILLAHIQVYLFWSIAPNSCIVKWQALTSRHLIVACLRIWSLLPSTSIQIMFAPQMELLAGYPGNLRNLTNSICTRIQDRLLNNVMAHFQGYLCRV